MAHLRAETAVAFLISGRKVDRKERNARALALFGKSNAEDSISPLKSIAWARVSFKLIGFPSSWISSSTNFVSKLS